MKFFILKQKFKNWQKLFKTCSTNYPSHGTYLGFEQSLLTERNIKVWVRENEVLKRHVYFAKCIYHLSNTVHSTSVQYQLKGYITSNTETHFYSWK